MAREIVVRKLSNAVVKLEATKEDNPGLTRLSMGLRVVGVFSDRALLDMIDSRGSSVFRLTLPDGSEICTSNRFDVGKPRTISTPVGEVKVTLLETPSTRKKQIVVDMIE